MRRDGGDGSGGTGSGSGGAGGLQIDLFGNPLLGASHGLSSWEAGDQTGVDLPVTQVYTCRSAVAPLLAHGRTDASDSSFAIMLLLA